MIPVWVCRDDKRPEEEIIDMQRSNPRQKIPLLDFQHVHLVLRNVPTMTMTRDRANRTTVRRKEPSTLRMPEALKAGNDEASAVGLIVDIRICIPKSEDLRP